MWMTQKQIDDMSAERDHLVADRDTLRTRAEATEATVAGLRAALEFIGSEVDCYCCAITGSGSNVVEHVDCKIHARIKEALAATPAKHAARIRELVLREAAEKLKPFKGFREGFYGDGMRDATNIIIDMADAAMKEGA